MKNEKRSILDSTLIGRNNSPTGLTDLAYCAIRDGILSGAIDPGTKLKQLQLADELNVDQRTIREALMRLVAQGLAAHELYKGFRAVELAIEEIKDIYRVRKILEKWAMESAATRISQDELARMRQLLPESCGDPDKPDPRRTQEANRKFHWVAISACGRRQLIRLLEQVWWEVSLAYVLRESVSKEERIRASVEDHTEHMLILEALESRDSGAAGKFAADHVQGSLENLLKRWELLHARGKKSRPSGRG